MKPVVKRTLRSPGAALCVRLMGGIVVSNRRKLCSRTSSLMNMLAGTQYSAHQLSHGRKLPPPTALRGLTISNASGKFQLYAWDLPSNALRQLTEKPTGIYK